jgi:hypothetical protein
MRSLRQWPRDWCKFLMQLRGVYSGISIIASDRLVRRSLNEKRWALGLVKPLESGEIHHALRQGTTALSRKFTNCLPIRFSACRSSWIRFLRNLLPEPENLSSRHTCECMPACSRVNFLPYATQLFNYIGTTSRAPSLLTAFLLSLGGA